MWGAISEKAEILQCIITTESSDYSAITIGVVEAYMVNYATMYKQVSIKIIVITHYVDKDIEC